MRNRISRYLIVVSLLLLGSVSASAAWACQDYTSTNDQHVTAGRATKSTSGYWWSVTTTYKAVGSNETIGTSGSTQTTLKEDPAGYFALGECPQPAGPAITSTQVVRDGTLVVISGTATDPDNDLTGILITSGMAWDYCAGTTQFTCELELSPATTYNFELSAWDSQDNQSEIVAIQVVMPGDTAPEVSSLSADVTNGQVRVSGTASDIDGDLEEVFMFFQGGSILCDGTENFECVLEGLEPGQYAVAARAVDSYDNTSEWVEVAFIVPQPPACVDYTATVNEHTTAGRAYKKSTSSWWTTTTTWYANGSNDNLGTLGSAVKTLKEQPQGYFALGTCPAEPQAPVVTAYQIDVLNHYKAVISGTATDADGDLVSVVLGLGAATGVPCEGTEQFTCTLWFDEYGITTGTTIGSYLSAKDSNDLTGITDVFEITRPENTAPTLSVENVAISGSTVTVTGSAADVDGDLQGIVFYLGGGGVQCDVNYPVESNDSIAYDCTDMNAWSVTFFNLEEGSYDFLYIKSFDIQSNESPLVHVPFSVAGPNAPVINGYEIVTLTNDALVITGTVSDADNDLQSMNLVFGAAMGIPCEGTYTFTCTVDFNEFGFEAGVPLQISLYAVDATDLTDQIFLEVIRPEAAAPVIENWNVSVTGTSVTITGAASDADGDLASVVLTGLVAPLTCSGTTTFTCEASGLAVGDYSLELVAQDAKGNLSAAAGPINFTIQSQSACTTATNSAHASAGRATLMYNVLYYANGSNDYLGLGTATTSLQETAPGYWEMVSTCP